MFGRRSKKEFQHTGRSPEAAEFLATQLERLLALPLTTPDDVKHWNEECHTVQTTLEQRFPHFMPEHEVLHFFDDVDIRCRDKGYLEYQHGIMFRYVQFLRNEPDAT